MPDIAPTSRILPPPVPEHAAGYAAVASYLLLKLLRAPRDEAIRLLDGMRLDPATLPDMPVGPREITASIGRAIAHLHEGRPAEAIALAAGAADRWIALVDDGRVDEAIRVLKDAALDRIAPGPDLNAILEVLAGAVVLAANGTLSDGSAQARVNLFAQTDGAFQDLVHWLVAARRPPPATDRSGLLEADTTERLGHILSVLDTDGYWVSDRRLADDVCERLVAFAASAPATVTPPSAGPAGITTVDLSNGQAEGYNIIPQAAFDCPDVRAILSDPSVTAVAAARLGCSPVLTMAAMRWSLPNPGGPSVDLAQLYHWDAGYIRWINVFFYLTNVETTNGPHVYVRGTHRRGAKPEPLLRRGYARIPDKEIEAAYPAEDIVTLTGPHGSIFVGDTRCWHKGTPVQEGRRLTLQVIFADSLIAAPPMPRVLIRRSYGQAFRDFVAANPTMFPPQYYEVEPG